MCSCIQKHLASSQHCVIDLRVIDICCCLQEPLTDPVVAADGFTYERSSIQKHLASSRISPVSGKPMSSTLYENRLVASILAKLTVLPQPGA